MGTSLFTTAVDLKEYKSRGELWPRGLQPAELPQRDHLKLVQVHESALLPSPGLSFTAARAGACRWTDLPYPEFPLLWLSPSKGVLYVLEPKCSHQITITICFGFYSLAARPPPSSRGALTSGRWWLRQ